jgi:hypothetical protein
MQKELWSGILRETDSSSVVISLDIWLWSD